jgi:hypothetical protein
MRIEKWLHEEYAGLRPFQHRALREQLTENEKVLGKRVKEFTPEKVYNASVVMNTAYARFIGAMLDQRRYFAPYQRTQYGSLGDRLGHGLWESPDSGYQEDTRVIERWSTTLGLEGWWEWKTLVDKEV